MKNYLESLIRKMLKGDVSNSYHNVFITLLNELEYYERQFNQFDIQDNEDIEDAIELLCSLPAVVHTYPTQSRKKLREAIRFQVPELQVGILIA